MLERRTKQRNIPGEHQYMKYVQMLMRQVSILTYTLQEIFNLHKNDVN